MYSNFLIFLTISFSSLITIKSSAQNLVKNGDFEKYSSIPGVSSLIDCEGWFEPIIYGTADYFHEFACPSNCVRPQSVWVPQNWFGYQKARSGRGYIGIHLYDEQTMPNLLNREYATTRLIEPLEVGERYKVEYWVSLAEYGGYFGTPPQILFHHYIEDRGVQAIYALPQVFSTDLIRDTINWIKISKEFVADQAYPYLTIGNFFQSNDARFFYLPNRNYILNKRVVDFYIEDVSVTVAPPPKPNLGPDIIMCDNEKRTLSSDANKYNHIWSTGETTKTIEVDKAGIYILTLEHKGLKSSDTLIVTTKPSPKINLGVDTGICTSGSIDFTLTAEEGNYFFWKPSDSTTQSIQVTDFGVYSVRSLFENGCSSEDTIRVYDNCPPCFTELNVFPNPVKELLHINFIFNYNKQSVKYRLISDNGQVAFTDYVDLKKGLNNIDIALPTLSTGVYIFEMNLECGKMTWPLIVKQTD